MLLTLKTDFVETADATCAPLAVRFPGRIAFVEASKSELPLEAALLPFLKACGMLDGAPSMLSTVPDVAKEYVVPPIAVAPAPGMMGIPFTR